MELNNNIELSIWLSSLKSHIASFHSLDSHKYQCNKCGKYFKSIINLKHIDAKFIQYIIDVTTFATRSRQSVQIFGNVIRHENVNDRVVCDFAIR